MTDSQIQQLIKALEPFLEGKIKETVSHAKNNLHSEESLVASSILDKMGIHIKTTIDDKLKPLSDKLDNYIKDDTRSKEELAATLLAWKEEITPVIEMGKNVQGFGKVSLYILGFVASVSAGFYALVEFFKKN